MREGNCEFGWWWGFILAEVEGSAQQRKADRGILVGDERGRNPTSQPTERNSTSQPRERGIAHHASLQREGEPNPSPQAELRYVLRVPALCSQRVRRDGFSDPVVSDPSQRARNALSSSLRRRYEQLHLPRVGRADRGGVERQPRGQLLAPTE